jgi:hypothetical protein
MRTLFLFLFMAIGVSAQAQIDDSLPPWFRAEFLLDRLSENFTDLRPRQMSSIRTALNKLVASAPKKPNARQKLQAQQRIRRTITQYLDPKQLEQLKTAKGNGAKDALDRIIDQSTTRRQ